MLNRLVSAVTWLLVAGSVAIILGGLLGRPVLLAAVPTGSMVPVLRPGDLIVVSPYLGNRLRPGQIVVFRTEKDTSWIVHRVISGDSAQGYVTQGDSNPLPDPYPVLPRHVVGIVPTLGDEAIRIPRLGLLSLERSPLANPLVTGIALVLGLYLMATDARAGLRSVRGFRFRMTRVRTVNAKPRVALALYVSLAVSVFFISLLTMWSLGGTQTGAFTVAASKPSNSQFANMLVPGESRTETIKLKNPSLIPLVMALESNDPDAAWSRPWIYLRPLAEESVELRMYGGTMGEHKLLLREAIYLPLLPTAALQWLSGIQWHLPIFVVSLIPSLIILVIALSDVRVKIELQNLNLALQSQLRRS